jgi:hypothetical protein
VFCGIISVCYQGCWSFWGIIKVMCFLFPALPCLLIFVSSEAFIYIYIYIYSTSGLINVQITHDTVMELLCILRTVLFWVIMQQVVVIYYWCFGKTYWSLPQIQDSWTQRLGPKRLSWNIAKKLPVLAV